jgi:hypothetical protein
MCEQLGNLNGLPNAQHALHNQPQAAIQQGQNLDNDKACDENLDKMRLTVAAFINNSLSNRAKVSDLSANFVGTGLKLKPTGNDAEQSSLMFV